MIWLLQEEKKQAKNTILSAENTKQVEQKTKSKSWCDFVCTSNTVLSDHICVSCDLIFFGLWVSNAFQPLMNFVVNVLYYIDCCTLHYINHNCVAHLVTFDLWLLRCTCASVFSFQVKKNSVIWLFCFSTDFFLACCTYGWKIAYDLLNARDLKTFWLLHRAAYMTKRIGVKPMVQSMFFVCCSIFTCIHESTHRRSEKQWKPQTHFLLAFFSLLDM